MTEKTAAELFAEWQSKLKGFEEAQAHYLTAHGLCSPHPQLEMPERALTPEALDELGRLEEDAEEAERAWRLALRIEGSAAEEQTSRGHGRA